MSETTTKTESKAKAKPKSGEAPVPATPPLMFLPPTLFIMFISAGLVLNWIFPLRFGHLWGGLGLLLIAAAFGLTHWAKSEFEKAGTPVAPNLPAKTLVTGGPYQYVRNPMYISFFLSYAGMAALADTPLMLLLLVPLYFVLDQKLVPAEEEHLAENFGEDYAEYMEATPRWCGFSKLTDPITEE